MTTEIPKQQLREWISNPVTKQVLKLVEAKVENLHKDWEDGRFTHIHKYAAAQAQARALGELDALRWIEDIMTDNGETDGEPFGPEAQGSSDSAGPV